MAFSEPEHLASQTGATLCLRHEPADGEAIGAVLICHGLAEHSARYAPFARELAHAGFHAYAHDHRGHGQTTAPDAPATVFSLQGDGAEKVLADIGAVHAHISERHPGLPVILFGHSMGGLIAMNYLLRHAGRLAGAAVWNASFSGGALGRLAQGLLAWERFRLGSDVPSRILPRLTFGEWAKSVPDRRTEFDWLSRDPAVVDAYVADPLCGWDASVGMWQDVFKFVFSGADVDGAPQEAKSLPVHLAGGGRDPATSFGRAVGEHAKRLRKAGFSEVTLAIHPDFRHETLNEAGREPVIADFIAWLREKAGVNRS